MVCGQRFIDGLGGGKEIIPREKGYSVRKGWRSGNNTERFFKGFKRRGRAETVIIIISSCIGNIKRHVLSVFVNKGELLCRKNSMVAGQIDGRHLDNRGFADKKLSIIGLAVDCWNKPAISIRLNRLIRRDQGAIFICNTDCIIDGSGFIGLDIHPDTLRKGEEAACWGYSQGWRGSIYGEKEGCPGLIIIRIFCVNI